MVITTDKYICCYPIASKSSPRCVAEIEKMQSDFETI